MLNKKALLAELAKRRKEASSSKEVFSFYDVAFDKQVELFKKEESRFRTAVCSRRAGKTIGIAADMLDIGSRVKEANLLYITLTRNNAKKIIWHDLKKLADEYNINVKLNEADLSVYFPDTGARVHMAGVKDKTEIEKFRGWRLTRCYIDECQSFRPYIKELIDDIIIPALRDERGALILTGTPGPVPAGPFYEYSTSSDWANYHWTAFNNPHMHNPPEKDLNLTLEEERKIKGITEDDAGYQRETYGLWIEDLDSLVFKYNKDINHYTKMPPVSWSYVFGIDIGHSDADAIAVLAFNERINKVYLVEESLNRKQNITELVADIKRLQTKYKPIRMVMDAGALGKKIQEEITRVHHIPVKAAEKSRKSEYIELLNDDLRTGRLKAEKNSEFAQDCFRVQWDIDKEYKKQVSDSYHSDITDAVLYGWRECLHHLGSMKQVVPPIDSDRFMDEYEERLAQKMKEDAEKDEYDQLFEDDFEW